jgi:hypothetical protein
MREQTPREIFFCDSEPEALPHEIVDCNRPIEGAVVRQDVAPLLLPAAAVKRAICFRSSGATVVASRSTAKNAANRTAPKPWPIHMFFAPKTRRSGIPSTWSCRSVVMPLTFPVVSALLLIVTDGALAASSTLGWTASTITTGYPGYQVHFGSTRGMYTQASDVVGAATANRTVANLTAGSNYCSAVRLRNQDSSQTSAFSNEVSVTIPSDDATAPTVSLSISPTDSSYTAAQTATLSASTADRIGALRVDFSDGLTLVATETSVPFRDACWSPVPPTAPTPGPPGPTTPRTMSARLAALGLT